MNFVFGALQLQSANPKHFQPRNALARNLWLIESSPRYLQHGVESSRIPYFRLNQKDPNTIIDHLRSEQRAGEIYDSGKTFLRTHRVLTIISQRRDLLILIV